MRILARRQPRPWPERPVSEANMSGSDTAAARRVLTRSRSLMADGE